MKRLFLLLASAFVIMALPMASNAVDAVNDWTRCNSSLNGSALSNGGTISGKQHQCFEFNETHGTTDITITINVPQAKICLLTDTESAGVGDVRASLYDCQRGLAVSAAHCSVNAIKSYTTDSCFAVSTGVYLFDVTTGVTSGEVAILYVQPY